MAIYTMTFLIAEILAVIVSIKSKKENKKAVELLVLGIIIILSLLGGLRGITIGTDLRVYGERWFNVAINSESFSIYKKIINTTDIGYIFLNYIISRFTSNFNIYLFIHQLICNGIVITVLYKCNKRVPFAISLLCYLSFFYGRTFNLLRQAIALSVVFYGISNLIENKEKKFVVYILIATLFHFTAVFSLIILPIKRICYSDNNRKKLYIFIIIIIAIIATINIEPVVKFAYIHGIVNKRIYNYLFDFVNISGKTFDFELVFKTCFLLLVVLNSKKLKKISKENYFLIISIIIEFILFQIRYRIKYADRISLYFGYQIMLILPQIIKTVKKGKDKLLLIIIITVLLVIYWYYKFVHSGSCEIYPYRFFWE